MMNSSLYAHLLEALRASYYLDFKAILSPSQDREIVELLVKDDPERKKKLDELKALLQQEANNKENSKKKEENEEFFARLDISWLLEETYLSILLKAYSEEIRRTYETDAARWREGKREQAGYDNQVESYSSPALLEINNILASAFNIQAQLQNAIARFNALQQQVNNWQAQQWRPAVAQAAQTAAQTIVAQIAAQMGVAPQQLSHLGANITEKLSHLASPPELKQYVTQLSAVPASRVMGMQKLGTEMMIAAAIRELGLPGGVRSAVAYLNSLLGQNVVNDYYGGLTAVYDRHLKDQSGLVSTAKEVMEWKARADDMAETASSRLSPQSNSTRNVSNQRGRHS